jgi:hypothetical protein
MRSFFGFSSRSLIFVMSTAAALVAFSCLFSYACLRLLKRSMARAICTCVVTCIGSIADTREASPRLPTDAPMLPIDAAREESPRDASSSPTEALPRDVASSSKKLAPASMLSFAISANDVSGGGTSPCPRTTFRAIFFSLPRLATARSIFWSASFCLSAPPE